MSMVILPYFGPPNHKTMIYHSNVASMILGTLPQDYSQAGNVSLLLVALRLWTVAESHQVFYVFSNIQDLMKIGHWNPILGHPGAVLKTVNSAVR